MRLLESFKGLFRRKPPKAERSLKKRERTKVNLPPEEPWNVRRWDSATNNSCLPNRWQSAHGQSINVDLDADLRSLMARCSHEFANNPIFEGVVNQFVRDVVGPEGPTLQILSESEEFNNAVEEAWKPVFAKPNPKRPSVGGVDSMKQWVRLLCNAGSYLNIFTEPRRESGVRFGWRTLHPRRLVTPPNLVGDRVAFGIKVDEDGNPIEYYIDKQAKFGPLDWSSYGVDFDTLPASQVQHRYIEIEPEQMTGYPLMSSTLNAAAEIRDLDQAEIRAQQRNAKNSLGLQATSPESVVDPDPIDGTSYPMSDDEVNVAPLGWAWQTLDNNRPSPDHINYRRERISELGRPIGMPLILVLLSVGDANFSSAQFAGMVYAEAIKEIQSFIARLTLNELVEMVILELVLSGKVQRPEKYEKRWTHYVPPNANLEKFAKTLRSLVEDGIISRSTATSWLGFDPEEMDELRKRDNDRAEDLDISPPPTNSGSGNQQVDTKERTEELEEQVASISRTVADSTHGVLS